MNRITESNPPWMGEEMWASAREPDDEMMEEVYCKLWSYENTGLEPEEIHPSACRWISVKDDPPKQTFLFVWCEVAKCVEIAKYNGCFWVTQEKRRALNADWITHWMHLPEAPKEGDVE